MSYMYADTGKEELMREINRIAEKYHEQPYEFDPAWMTTYEDLLDLKHELLNRHEE